MPALRHSLFALLLIPAMLLGRVHATPKGFPFTPTATPSPSPTRTPTPTPPGTVGCSLECAEQDCILACNNTVCGMVTSTDLFGITSTRGDRFFLPQRFAGTEVNLELTSPQGGWNYAITLSRQADGFEEFLRVASNDTGEANVPVRMTTTLPIAGTVGGFWIFVSHFGAGTPELPKSYQLTLSCGQPVAPLSCVAGSMMGQLPDFQPHGSGAEYALISEEGSHQVIEDFGPLPAPICAVRWWGVEGLSSPCAKATDAFNITFFGNEGEGPGNIVAGPFQVAAVGLEVGLTLQLGESHFPVRHYQANVPCVDLPSGWVSVVAVPDPEGCTFRWLTGPGNGQAAVVAEGLSGLDLDLALCLGTAPRDLLIGQDVAYGSDRNRDGVWDAADMVP